MYSGANPHVAFSPEYQGFDGYYQKPMLLAASNNMPDIFQFYVGAGDANQLGEDEVGKNRVLNFELPTYASRYTAQLDEHEPTNPDTPMPPLPPTDVVSQNPKAELGPDGVIRVDNEDQDGSSPTLNATINRELATKALEGSADGKLRIRSGGTLLKLDEKWIGDLKLDDSLSMKLKTENAVDLPESLRLSAERTGVEYVCTIDLSADGQPIAAIKRGSATVSIPYESEDGDDPHRLVVYELLEDGSLIPVALSRYDAENGWMIFQPDRLSRGNSARIAAGTWWRCRESFL